MKRCWYLMFMVGCSTAEIHDPPMQNVDAGIILAETVEWLTQDYKLTLPQHAADVDVHVSKPCCTRAEIISRNGQEVVVRLKGQYQPLQEGPMTWIVELTADGRRAAVLSLQAYILSAIALKDSPLTAGIRVVAQPVEWKTVLEIRLPQPLETTPQPEVVAGNNPQFSFGPGVCRQQGNLYILSYPMTARFVPENVFGLHEQAFRITVPGTPSPLVAKIAWYEAKGSK
jgi:hypothetical protein